MQKIFSLICSRPAGLCNFLDAPELESFLSRNHGDDDRWRVVYRNYATLFFVLVVDGAESELGILDLIQVSKGCGPTYFNANIPRCHRCSWKRSTAHSRMSAS